MIFLKRSELFENSITETLDPNYLIGSGDEIIHALGPNKFNQSHVVTKDGYLFIENIGQVFLNGLTLQKLENKLFKMFTKVHSSMDSSKGPASTYFDMFRSSYSNQKESLL